MLNEPMVIFPGWGFEAKLVNHFMPTPNLNHCVTFPLIQKANQFIPAAETLVKTLPKNATIYAWSLGGLLLLYLLDHYDIRYKQIIFAATTPFFLANNHWHGINHTVATDFFNLATNNLVVAKNKFIQWVTFPHHQYARRQQLTSFLLTDRPHSAIAYLELLFTLDLRSTFRKLTNAICILGENDCIVTKDNVGQLQTLNPHISIEIIPNASHAIFMPNESC